MLLRTSMVVNSAFITMFDFTPLFTRFNNDYYTSLTMAIVELATIIIAFRYKQKTRIWAVFTFYLCFDFTILISDFLLESATFVSQNFRDTYYTVSNTLISLIELTCYYIYINALFKSARIRKILIIAGISFATISCIYFWAVFSFSLHRISYYSHLLGAAEFLLIFPFCLIYFKHLLNTSSHANVLHRPSFWIITGIFFYSLFSIPSYLLFDYIKQNLPLVSFNINTTFYYIPFTINFIFLAKAFSLKKELSV